MGSTRCLCVRSEAGKHLLSPELEPTAHPDPIPSALCFLQDSEAQISGWLLCPGCSILGSPLRVLPSVPPAAEGSVGLGLSESRCLHL